MDCPASPRSQNQARSRGNVRGTSQSRSQSDAQKNTSQARNSTASLLIGGGGPQGPRHNGRKQTATAFQICWASLTSFLDDCNEADGRDQGPRPRPRLRHAL